MLLFLHGHFNSLWNVPCFPSLQEVIHIFADSRSSPKRDTSTTATPVTGTTACIIVCKVGIHEMKWGGQFYNLFLSEFHICPCILGKPNPYFLYFDNAYLCNTKGIWLFIYYLCIHLLLRERRHEVWKREGKSGTEPQERIRQSKELFFFLFFLFSFFLFL